jgi:hypothetical protein
MSISERTIGGDCQHADKDQDDQEDEEWDDDTTMTKTKRQRHNAMRRRQDEAT